MNIREIIENRVSVRLYQDRDVDEVLLQQVLQAGHRGQGLFSSIETRFMLVKNTEGFHSKISGYVGYLGNVMPAPYYIFGLSQNKPGYQENMGYKMEQMMLKAVELGLGTCWIGISKYEKRIAEMLKADAGERIVTLTPVGYEKQSKTEKFFSEILFKEPKQRAAKKQIREFVHSHRLDAPLDHLVTDQPKLMEIFELVRKAPSWANVQPWDFIVTPREVLFVVHKEQEFCRIDGGIAMLYYSLMAREHGLPYEWDMQAVSPSALLKDYEVGDRYEYLGKISLS